LHSTSYLLNPPSTHNTHTLSLHDALPIFNTDRESEMRFNSGLAIGALIGRMAFSDKAEGSRRERRAERLGVHRWVCAIVIVVILDRKSTRLNSSHQIISYAVFCLNKKRHS